MCYYRSIENPVIVSQVCVKSLIYASKPINLDDFDANIRDAIDGIIPRIVKNSTVQHIQ